MERQRNAGTIEQFALSFPDFAALHPGYNRQNCCRPPKTARLLSWGRREAALYLVPLYASTDRAVIPQQRH